MCFRHWDYDEPSPLSKVSDREKKQNTEMEKYGNMKGGSNIKPIEEI